MAYTSVIPVRRLKASVDYVLDQEKTSRSRNAASLEKAVDYALNPQKTERDLFRSGIACVCETAFEDMRRVKQMWHKESGVQGFHLVQSFAAGEVTAELAHRIGLELAGQLLQGKYQAVVSTHLNTGHIHNHIVWNSVSLEDGKKYRSNAKSYYTEVRAISDRLCAQHGLSVIKTDYSDRVARPYVQWLAEKEDRPTWKTAIRQDIDEAVAQVFTWSQFLRALEDRGYTLRLDRKYITLCPPGKQRPVRFKTLGRKYTPDAIRRRILYPQPQRPAGKKRTLPPALSVLAAQQPVRRFTGLRGLYLSYLYQVGVLPRKPKYPGYAVREDIRKLDERIQQMEFIFRHGIEDLEQLSAVRQTAQEKADALLRERYRLYRREPGSPRIEEITAQLRGLRRTVKLCKAIAEHSDVIRQRMQQDEKQRQAAEQQKNTEKQNEKEKVR